MGCSASQKPSSAPPAEATAPEKIVESQTWATKTEEIQKVQKVGQGARAQPVVLQDAEDEDEVEILTDAHTEVKTEPLPARTEPLAANAQEAPSSLESSSTTSPSRPLPKQQQEEAAKLAETRRRFDNQRYQREHQSTGAGAGANTSPVNHGAKAAMGRGSLPNSFGPPGALPGAPDIVEELELEPTSISGNAGAKAASSGGPSGVKTGPPDGVNHPLVVGLSLNKAEGNVDDSKLGAFLPGGILDDSDLPGSTMVNHKEPPAKSATFSADDEALMREILEDVDDLETV